MNYASVPAEPQAKRYKLLFADDHKFLLDAFTYVAREQYDVEVVSSVQEVEAAVKAHTPDLAILDVQMRDGDGFIAARRARAINPDLKVMFLSMHTDPRYVRRASEVGACGYLSKSAPAGELLGAIDTVVKGGVYKSDLPQTISADSDSGDLTDRQVQVLRLISQGMSAKEIANSLNISVRTAEFHRAAIMERLKLNSTAMLTRYAIEHGIG